MSNVAFFPTPYPDEDFRSIIYRYHVRVGYGDFMNTNIELFGMKTYNNSPMPRNLSAFIKNMPSSHCVSLDEFLFNNTLWPLVKLFLSNEQIERSMQEFLYRMKGGKNSSVQQLLNKNNKILSMKIRYCPQCLLDDFRKYGECFVHRSHQIDTVDVCPYHHILLIERCPVCNVELARRKGTLLLLIPECSAGHSLCRTVGYNNENLTAKLELYQDIQTIMLYSKEINRQEILNRFQIALVRKGYTHLSGKIKKAEFIKGIQAALLNCSSVELGSLVEFNESTASRMFCSQRSNVMSLTLLIFIMRFLCGSVEAFFNSSMAVATTLPFGVGPWECINKICPDYGAQVIKSCEREIKLGNTVSAKFVCPTCGCTYHKRWRMGVDDPETKPKVSTMGSLWYRRLFELSTQGHTNFQIAKKLKCDSSTVLAGMRRLQNLEINRDEDLEYEKVEAVMAEIQEASVEVAATTVPNEKNLLIRRETILQILRTNSKLSRKGICKLASSSYLWLMKYDRDWMEEILPKQQHSPRTPLDWQILDKELCERIKLVVKQIYGENPTRRISRNLIRSACLNYDSYHLERNINKLPHTSAILLEYEESKEDFLIRNTPKVAAELVGNGYTNVTLNSILAYKKSYRGCSNRVRVKIVNILRDMGFKNVDFGMEYYI